MAEMAVSVIFILSDFGTGNHISLDLFKIQTYSAKHVGIYTQTELYMLTDYSPGYSDTWESLNRRCQDMESLSVLSGKVGRILLMISLRSDHCRELVDSKTDLGRFVSLARDIDLLAMGVANVGIFFQFEE